MHTTEQQLAGCFSPGVRRTLAAVAETAIPPGNIFPGAGERTIEKVERLMLEGGPGMSRGYRALVWALDAAALVSHRHRFAELTPPARLEVLESWRAGDYLRRTALRALTAPLKLAHFNDPELYHKVGCVYGAPEAATEKAPRWRTERVHGPDEVAGQVIECDAVVIGTGAGGAVVARELAERGLAVVMLEEGEWFSRADFTGHGFEMQRKLFRNMGATFSLGNVGIPIPMGRTVGGTTTINSGTCYRVPDRVLTSWRDQHGLADFSPEMLDPYYTRVEEVLGVAEARGEYLGGVARLIGRGCDALGYRHKPLRRNAPDCDGQGVCCFGCPTDAKRSTNVSYVPLALRAGATLIKGITADGVIVEGGRAVGVTASARGREVTVRARAVIVSCGALLTPVFLARQGLASSSGQLGRNLSIHPAAAAIALFDEDVSGYKAIPQGYAIEEFQDEGLLFEGAFAPLDVGAASIYVIGEQFTRIVEAYDRLACFGFMIEDSSRGTVRRGPGGKPLITYFVNDQDLARLKRGVEILTRVYFAAGAKVVHPGVHGFDRFESPEDLRAFQHARVHARDFDLSAYHPLGTARMGIDARTSVVGPDHQAHDVPGLYIVDGSAVPSSLAVNPQLTIMALATRAAEKLAARLG